jgi:hypothetical protein
MMKMPAAHNQKAMVSLVFHLCVSLGANCCFNHRFNSSGSCCSSHNNSRLETARSSQHFSLAAGTSMADDCPSSCSSFAVTPIELAPVPVLVHNKFVISPPIDRFRRIPATHLLSDSLDLTDCPKCCHIMLPTLYFGIFLAGNFPTLSKFSTGTVTTAKCNTRGGFSATTAG